MRGLFSLLLSSIFNTPLERYSSQNKADHKNGNTPDAAQKRAAAKNGRLEESQSNLEMNLKKFDKAREDSYDRPFRMAVEYKKALKMIKAGAPVESGWTVLKQSKS